MRVPPAPFDDGYYVRGPWATRVGKRKERVPLSLCFIDLQKV